MQLEKFNTEAFLSECWQKKPLLIRNPWKLWVNPLTPDELAGLACEEEVESRLVLQNGRAWKLEHGPFAERRFARLGDSPWTLLVQSVDQFVPEVARLTQPFRFLPNWRIDDIMVSYATDGGGVGPHFDQYDVFLIQGLGRRRWRVGPSCNESTPLLPHNELRLLPGFEATQEWILEPGDILYVPPGVAHDGVAIGKDCMTYSIGFRAPAPSELIAGWSEHLMEQPGRDARYSDADLEEQENPGEITAQAIERLHDMVREQMGDVAAFGRWFGQHNSARKFPGADWAPEEPISIHEVRQSLARGSLLHRASGSRFSFMRQGAGPVLLFTDGATYECQGEAARIAKALCASDSIRIDPGLATSDAVTSLVVQLLNNGSAEFGEPDQSESH